MANTFKDSSDREWSVKVTVDAIEKVRKIEDREGNSVDLGDLTSTTLQRLLADDVLLVRVMWLLCEEEADKTGVSATQFGESMFGEPLDKAFDALRGALDLFFRSRRKYAMWKETVGKMLEEQQETYELAAEVLADPKLKKKRMDAKRARIRKDVDLVLKRLNSATDSPGSSASKRGRGRSVNSSG